MLRAAIFDMDGLLVDSEPLWTETEIEVYGELGVPVTPAGAAATKGLGLQEVVEHWRRVHPFKTDSDELVAAMTRGVTRRIRDRAVLRPGARAAVLAARDRGLAVALATSSPPAVIEAVLDRFDLRPLFSVVRSGASEPYGKPHPGVYLATAGALGISPLDAVAFEDSVNGVLAAKAARMRCVAVPAEADLRDPRFAIADLVLPSLVALTETTWSRLAAP
jgi:sugar-phosphatase